ncbi:hypothetical protein NQV05_01650 [Mycoplasmopsis agalactiae]|uniref:hypothetical protein n=1 Tax=Mycoplasmopsis agalactiae TaxID=2110 RepID=UPI00211B7E66|nr:hypothetical protein [Mycoplasmopsis agalactiae]UUM25828.1 hypothetical protein NQV05_01650 [Mycoplasmopsis agalactiae]
MALIDRDPEVAKARIEKRKAMLTKLHEQNINELSNPALIRDEDVPIHKHCDDPFCKIALETMPKDEKRKKLILKWIAIVTCILVIIAAIIIAASIGTLGNWESEKA